MIERLYLRLYDHLVGRSGLVLGLVGLAAVLAIPALWQVRLDMSFRPLFADNDAEAAATRDFEEVFGQPSGAFVGAVVEREDPLGLDFLRDLALLSAEVERLDGIVEVVSLARAPVAVWAADGARGALLIPGDLLNPGAEGAAREHLAGLRGSDRLRGTLLSADGRKTLLLARLEAPLENLAARQPTIEAFRALVTARLAGPEPIHFVGVSIVEEGYSRIVLRSLALSFLLTTIALIAVLWLVFRRIAAIVVVLAGVTLAIPLSVALLTMMGQDLTMINSMVPVLVLIIGVADGIHMLRSYALHLESGKPRGEAVRSMFGEMAVPCLLTTVTTMVGFLSLRLAHLAAIRDFGLSVATGTAVVYVLNLVLIPLLLTRIPASRLPRRGEVSNWVEGSAAGVASLVIRWPGRVALISMLSIAAAGAAIPGLRLDQRFNEEVGPEHPLRASQALMEREFGGFLGPELQVRRRDGGSPLATRDLESLGTFVSAIRGIPGVLRVESVLDHLPTGPASSAGRQLQQLRSDPILGARLRELLGPGGTLTAIHVRTEDLGTARAAELGHELALLADRHLGPDLEARVVGQWWLAQRGMQNLLRDMLVSFFASCLLILPVVAIFLRRARLILIGVLPNLLPILFALALMSWAGISLRIGTAMVLAIALAIGIDDTVHLLVRLRREADAGLDPAAAVRATLEGTGAAIFQTTIVLVLGFLSMLSSELLAVREMGLVAAAALTVALLADLCLAPSLYLLVARLERFGAAPAVTAPATPLPRSLQP